MAKIANFEIHIELKELKIHVKGDRELAPEIATEVAHKISGMIQPAGLIDAPSESQNGHHQVIDSVPTAPRKRRRSPSKQTGPANVANGTPVSWAHEHTKWGTPLQDWKQWQKIAWLLYVVENETGNDGLATGEIVDIFAARFKASGLITKGNIPRDLNGKAEYFGSLNDRWHLKQAGKDEAVKLVAQAKGGKITG